MDIEKAKAKDLPMLRKMRDVAKSQIARDITAGCLPDPDIQLELLKVSLKIEELESESESSAQ